MARHSSYAAVLVSAVLVLSVVGTTAALAATKPSSSPAITADGKKLYRQYCGSCHALAAALSAGFGSSKKKGLGQDGGPSFNSLRIPYAYSVAAVTEPTGGHELLRHQISAKKLHTVAAWLAQATRSHPIPAFPTGG